MSASASACPSGVILGLDLTRGGDHALARCLPRSAIDEIVHEVGGQ